LHLSTSSSLSSSPSPSSHDIAVVVVVVVVVVAGIVVIILVVVVVVVGVCLSRVRELGGLISASQCRVIAENGLGLTSICEAIHLDRLHQPRHSHCCHHQYSHHHNDQHVSTMNASIMIIPAAPAPPLQLLSPSVFSSP